MARHLALAINKLGRFTKTGSALLVMGIGGGAIIPLIYAGLVDSMDGNRQLPYAIMIPCYLVILYFAAVGHKKVFPPDKRITKISKGLS